MILQYRTLWRRRQALAELPEGLADSFTSMIDRIKQSKHRAAKLAMKVLMWLNIAYRPPKVNELLEAVALEPGDVGLNRDNLVLPQILLDCCLGLVVIDSETN